MAIIHNFNTWHQVLIVKVIVKVTSEGNKTVSNKRENEIPERIYFLKS